MDLDFLFGLNRILDLLCLPNGLVGPAHMKPNQSSIRGVQEAKEIKFNFWLMKIKHGQKYKALFDLFLLVQMEKLIP